MEYGKKILILAGCLFLYAINTPCYGAGLLDQQTVGVLSFHPDREVSLSKLATAIVAENLAELAPEAKVVFGSKLQKQINEANLDISEITFDSNKDSQQSSQLIKKIGALLDLDFICFVVIEDAEREGAIKGRYVNRTRATPVTKLDLKIYLADAKNGEILVEKARKGKSSEPLSMLGLCSSAAPGYTDLIRSNSKRLLKKILKEAASVEP
ncbi:MAG: hypothetical protein ABIH45_05500 [Candidatus Omnitrophota bacterium]